MGDALSGRCWAFLGVVFKSDLRVHLITFLGVHFWIQLGAHLGVHLRVQLGVFFGVILGVHFGVYLQVYFGVHFRVPWGGLGGHLGGCRGEAWRPFWGMPRSLGREVSFRKSLRSKLSCTDSVHLQGPKLSK